METTIAQLEKELCAEAVSRGADITDDNIRLYIRAVIKDHNLNKPNIDALLEVKQ